jgi:ABC-type sugar transport system permease subunit
MRRRTKFRNGWVTGILTDEPPSAKSPRAIFIPAAADGGAVRIFRLAIVAKPGIEFLYNGGAALGLAMLLNHPAVKMKSLLRFCFFSTYLVGQVFVAVVFFALLAPRRGLVNRGLSEIIPAAANLDWLTRPSLVLPATLLAGLWLSIGYGMIYFLAALQTVDANLYEAAILDGAGKWAAFRHVTLPGIRPVLVFLVVVGTIGGFQLFELPYVLLQGPGPNYRALTIVMYLYASAFDRGDLGYSAAIGWLLVLLLGAVSAAQLKLSGALRDDA